MLLVVVTACQGGGGGPTDDVGDDRDAHNAGPLPTLPGGVELTVLDPTAVLVGTELAFGTPLPSEQAAADGFSADPEVASAVARRVHATTDGRRLGDALVLVLDGNEIFDEAALAAFERAAVEAIAGGEAAEQQLAGRTVLRAASAEQVVLGFREGNLLTVVRGADEADVVLTVTRQLEAIARGEVGSPDPVTPLIGLAPGAAFIPVPTVSFEPIPPPEEEPGPEVPSLPGATALEGRYGVVAGERRSTVWVFAVDLAAYPSAEALAPALPPLVSARAAGAAPEASEVIDRVVLAATNPDGEPSARVFRHQGLVVLVEGERAAQLDAVVTAWITALGPG